MKSRNLSYGVAWLACVGMVLPTAAFAGTPTSHSSPNPIQDIELTVNGMLSGQMLDSQGGAVTGVAVSLVSEGQSATVITDAAGRFAFQGLRGGTYQIGSLGSSRTVRAWHHQTAPPAATAQLLLVASDPLVRGQYGGGPVAGPVGGPVAGPAPMNGGYVDGACATGECAPGCCPPAPCGPECCPPPPCGGFGWLASPWVIGAIVAAAIAIPVAVSNDDDDGDAS